MGQGHHLILFRSIIKLFLSKQIVLIMLLIAIMAFGVLKRGGYLGNCILSSTWDSELAKLGFGGSASPKIVYGFSL